MKSLLKIKKKNKKTIDSQNKEESKSAATAFMRMQADMSVLELPDFVKINQDDIKANNLTDFRLSIAPREGYWKGGTFRFRYQVPDGYPYKPPKITCQDKIYHPNINYEGNVCLNILRKDWKPVLDTQNVIHGLIYLFLEPEPTDPLNEEAAKVMRESKSRFAQNVRTSMAGGFVDGEKFQRLARY
mmetsp:Transcript_15345/g.27572  ORF Transcript_15345/g.27572 Transcript_15345/m.27572 type:complete len:186 (-) Transcript_15345:33-590(-)|eukprot:CAMPEP_0197519444 /NCGR_PEP_ID=MMETSP1318-20131121/4703_1 /TAXON_ID=552666 /ORGANISM="Partenskyella glossopodia, Strain RCC365" /LENGTH=185 /DNA_ID=CAMNT_0043070417 /DNA_START=222 /DNA_END=779 /DNA_ORIENTATION=-